MSIEEIVAHVNTLAKLDAWLPDDLLAAANTVAGALGAFQDTALETQTYKFLAAARKVDLLYERDTRRGQASFNPSRVKFLRPKLAYAVSRKRELYPFFQVLDTAIGKVTDENDFDHLMSFVEAVIAYHRFKAVERQQERSRPNGRSSRETRHQAPPRQG